MVHSGSPTLWSSIATVYLISFAIFLFFSTIVIYIYMLMLQLYRFSYSYSQLAGCRQTHRFELLKTQRAENGSQLQLQTLQEEVLSLLKFFRRYPSGGLRIKKKKSGMSVLCFFAMLCHGVVSSLYFRRKTLNPRWIPPGRKRQLNGRLRFSFQPIGQFMP